MENRYWNSTGAQQEKYNSMETAGFEYTQATERVFHSYYRYYNDGDLPGWARSRWNLTRHTFDYGYSHRVLNAAGEKNWSVGSRRGSKSSTAASCAQLPNRTTPDEHLWHRPKRSKIRERRGSRKPRQQARRNTHEIQAHPRL